MAAASAPPPDDDFWGIPAFGFSRKIGKLASIAKQLDVDLRTTEENALATFAQLLGFQQYLDDTISHLVRHVRNLRQAIFQASPDTAEFQQLETDLLDATFRLKRTRARQQRNSETLQLMKDQIKGFVPVQAQPLPSEPEREAAEKRHRTETDLQRLTVANAMMADMFPDERSKYLKQQFPSGYPAGVDLMEAPSGTTFPTGGGYALGHVDPQGKQHLPPRPGTMKPYGTSGTFGMSLYPIPGRAKDRPPGESVLPLTLLRRMRLTRALYRPDLPPISTFHPSDVGYIPHSWDPATGTILVPGGWSRSALQEHFANNRYYVGNSPDSVVLRRPFGSSDVVAAHNFYAHRRQRVSDQVESTLRLSQQQQEAVQSLSRIVDDIDSYLDSRMQ